MTYVKISKYITCILIYTVLNLHVYNTAYATPIIKNFNQATLAFTLWDLKSDQSYIVDLEIKIIDLLEDTHAFKLNVISLINKKANTNLKDLQLYRWGVIGAVDDAILLEENQFKLYLGHIAAYDNDQSPTASNINHVRQRTKRLNYYFNYGHYSDGPYEVSSRSPGKENGHYETSWQGNFNGLSKNDLEGKGAQSMTLWSLMASDLKKLSRSKLGDITLSENGVLKFSPTIR